MPDAGFASLCLLSYCRPEFIEAAIRSAVENAAFPCEVLVHDDGSDEDVEDLLVDLKRDGLISHLILNPAAHNEGVGTAINRMFTMAQGDVLIKLDQDLLFEPGWLAKVVEVLAMDEAIGMLGLFKYCHEPVIWSDKRIHVPTLSDGPQWGSRPKYHYTRQFCGSGFAIPRAVYQNLGPFDEHLDAFNEDSEYMKRVRTSNWIPRLADVEIQLRELALFDEDVVTNRGFGIGPSTVVEEGYKVHAIHHGPLVIGEMEKSPPLQNEGDISFEYDWTLPPEVLDAAIGTAREVRGGSAESVQAATDLADAQTRFYEAYLGVCRFDVGVVITTCAGREENLHRVLDCIEALENVKPVATIVVFDGCEPDERFMARNEHRLSWVSIPKHAPGQEQPRNVGLVHVVRYGPEPACNYVWFLDSDLVFPPDTLEHFYRGLCSAPEDRILIGPYDWMAPGETEPHGRQLMADPRWAGFIEHGPGKVFRQDLGCGLSCFGGNLVWPVHAFETVGGFHKDLFHGRAEDGELGLRATEYGIPMSLVREARAWHVWHPIDTAGALEKNRRDIPLLNAWHEWAHAGGLVMTDQDGARFNWRCPDCLKVWLDAQDPPLVTRAGDDYNFFRPGANGERVELPPSVEVNSLELWAHITGHKETA